MKVQWRLVDVETNKVIPVGEVFDLVDWMETYFSTAEPTAWLEAVILCGDPASIENPIETWCKAFADMEKQGESCLNDPAIPPAIKELIRKELENNKRLRSSLLKKIDG